MPMVSEKKRSKRAVLARVAALTALWMQAGVLAQQAPRITSPANGATVSSGSTLKVTVDAAPFAFKSVFIAGQPVGFSHVLAAPPFQFQIPIPPETAAGTYTIEAVGIVEPGNWM